MSINVLRFKRINECSDPGRLQHLFDTFANAGAITVLRRHWNKLNHRLYDESLEEDLSAVALYGKALTKERMIRFWGPSVGIEKWDSYCEKQRVTNTLEYKKAVHGYSDEQFKKYNDSRAVTLKNLTSKYGEDEGTKRFKEYCELQKYVGSSEEYFVEKFGEVDGKARWVKVNKSKGHSFESYLERCGCAALAEEKLKDYYNRTSANYVSKTSKVFCESLHKFIYDLCLDCRYFSKDGKEFGIMDADEKRYYMYDFVIVDIGLIIEYNGDYYHANPEIYEHDHSMVNGAKAADIWNNDLRKKGVAEKRGFSVLYVWESEWLSNKNEILVRLRDEISKHKQLRG
jgi:very-short-patch-repair endonuclease